MRKINLLLCALLITLGVCAQRSNQVFITPDLGVQYSVVSVSPNGKWACGGIYDGVERGFLWNLTTGEITELSLQGTSSTAKGVSDEGVVSGSFETTEGTPNNRPILTYGIWKEGKWTTLELQNEETGAKISREGLASTISRHGEYVAGIAHSGSVYKPVVWENGRLNIVDDIEGAVYDISDDGNMLCGWTTHPEKKNRTSVLWKKQADGTYSKTCIDLNSPYAAGPFSVATGMSPNRKYIIACNTVYNTETGDTIRHYLDYYKSGFELTGVNNDGSVYGFVDNGEFPGGAEKIAVKITLDREIINVRDYIVSCGINLDNYPYVQSVVGISEDQKTYVLAAYDVNYLPCNIVVKLGVDTHMAPVTVSERKLEGLNGYVISWRAPLYTDDVVAGYNIYRNGEKLNTELLTSMQYTDVNLSAGDYTYSVTAVYEDSKESDKSQELKLTLADAQANAPVMFRAYASGLNDVRLIWEHPYTNLPAIRYVDDDDAIYGLGGDNTSFEYGIAARASELKLYKDAGYKISEISFVPKSRQNKWTLNFYTKGKYDKPIYSEEIPSENLRYGMVNYYTLKTPLEIPEGEDLVMAVFVDVTNYGGYDIVGMNTRKADAGYSDLIRQEGEEKLYSLYEQSMNSEFGAMEYNVCWTLGMHFSKDNGADDIKQYVISANGTEAGTSTENKFRLSNLEDGTYQIGVVAEYVSGQKSVPASAEVDVNADKHLCKAVEPTVTPGDGEASLTWQTPSANDCSFICYASGIANGGVLPRKDQDYSYTLGSLYKGNELMPYEGYEITSLRFYPLSDAEFVFTVYEDNEDAGTKTLAKGEGYVCGQWNTVVLDKPIKINRNSTYILSIDCNSCTPKKAPIAMDDQVGYPNVSDLYSLNGGYTYSSIYLDGGKDGNWMIGLGVESVEKNELPVEGYNIYLDDALSAGMITDNSYVIDNLSAGKHSVRVNPVYPYALGEKESDDVVFEITLSGIDNVTENTFDIERNASYIKINGVGVTGIEMYDVSGSVVATSDDSIIDITSLSRGIYVLNIHADGKTVKVKVVK